jgi:hypothetical protein
MPGCVFNASGAKFHVDAFIRDSPWKEIATAFRKGESTRLKTRPIEEQSGLGIRVSDSDEDRPETQVRDAMEFLEQERAELQRLVVFPGVEFLELRIGLFWWRDTLCQFHMLLPEFLKQAGGIGVAVTLCVYGVSEDEPEAEPSASADREDAAAEL